MHSFVLFFSLGLTVMFLIILDVTSTCKVDPANVMKGGSSFVLSIFDFRHWIERSTNYEVQLTVYQKASPTSVSTKNKMLLKGAVMSAFAHYMFAVNRRVKM